MPNVVLEIITLEQIKSFALDELNDDTEDSVRGALINDGAARDEFERIFDIAHCPRKKTERTLPLSEPLRCLRDSLKIYCHIAEKHLETPLGRVSEHRIGLRMEMIGALEAILNYMHIDNNISRTDLNHCGGASHRDNATDFEVARQRDHKALEELHELYRQLQPSRALIRIAEVIEALQNDLEKFSLAPRLASCKSRE